MTPALIFLGVGDAATVVTADLTAAAVYKTGSALVHKREGSPHMRLATWLVIGSVPTALLGPYLINWLAPPGGLDRTVRTWSLADGKQTAQMNAPCPVLSLSVSPDGKTLALGGQDNQVHLLGAVDGKRTLTLKGHAGPVNGVAFTPDGRGLASVSSESRPVVVISSSPSSPWTTRACVEPSRCSVRAMRSPSSGTATPTTWCFA